VVLIPLPLPVGFREAIIISAVSIIVYLARRKIKQ
jgi:hypothetical protein